MSGVGVVSGRLKRNGPLRVEEKVSERGEHSECQCYEGAPAYLVCIWLWLVCNTRDDVMSPKPWYCATAVQ